MKIRLSVLVILIHVHLAFSQIPQNIIFGAFKNENFADSILKRIASTGEDSTRVKLFNDLGMIYSLIRQDSSIFYTSRAIELAEKIDFQPGRYFGYVNLAFVLNTSGNYGKGLEMAIKSLKIAEKLPDFRLIRMARSYDMMGLINRRMNNDSIAISQCNRAIQLLDEAGLGLGNEKMNFSPYLDLSLCFLKKKNLDSAFYYAKKCYDITTYYIGRDRVEISVSASTVANVYEQMGNFPLARTYYQIAIEAESNFNTPLLRVRIYNNLARYFKEVGQFDSCILYGEMSYKICRTHQFGEQTTDAAISVAQSYELLHKPDSALKYTKIFLAAKDTIFNQSKLLQIQLLNFDEAQRQNEIQREIRDAQERYKNRIRYFALITTAVIFLLISLILYRNNRSKQIANKALEAQKMEISAQRTKAENALIELRSTQALLVQSEKMASLGELTAGIAHEIQNPLNFVNNFSEVNSELIEEMDLELEKGNIMQAKSISNEIRENEKKITHHGKRADSIVKGMLQHSRSSTGQMVQSDINEIADEYLRLSYHGLRAKEKNFNATMVTHFDPRIDKIDIIPQDIGRVLLNLYNNAFYAVGEKLKLSKKGYEPTVSVSTKKLDDKIELTVKDNGHGVSGKIMEKIFQPFFTTKPTGQGTGLGLSMSYDIIKAHRGEITVNTKEGEFTEFVIYLPA